MSIPPQEFKSDDHLQTNTSSNQSGSNDFVKKLFQMLQEDSYKAVVRWTKNGDSFVVIDTNEFTKDILPRHFKHSNFASFVRQLNKYDFHKVKISNEDKQNYEYGEDAWEFKHPEFRANDRDALDNIKRKAPTSKKSGTFNVNPHISSYPENRHVIDHVNGLRDSVEYLNAENKSLRHEINVLHSKYNNVVENLVTARSFDERYNRSMIILVNALAQNGIKLPALDFPDPNLEFNHQPQHQNQHQHQNRNQTQNQNQNQNHQHPQHPQHNRNNSHGNVNGINYDQSYVKTPVAPTQSFPPEVKREPLSISPEPQAQAQAQAQHQHQLPLHTTPNQSLDGNAAKVTPRKNSQTGGEHFSPLDQMTAVNKETQSPNQQLNDNTPPLLNEHRKSNDSVTGNNKPESTGAPVITTNLVNPKFNVLLVEDDNVCIQLCRKFLVKYGCQVTVVTDGLNAISTVENTKYDLVLMDIVMPNLDGATATSVIRSFDTRTPIIAMTGNIEDNDLVTYLQNGMSDILAKPFTKDDLYSILSKHLLSNENLNQNSNGDQGNDANMILDEANDNLPDPMLKKQRIE